MKNYWIILLLLIGFSHCKEDDDQDELTVVLSAGCDNPSFFNDVGPRQFYMGFSSWNFGPDQEDVDATYNFLMNNGDVYSEHMDNYVPWKAWINNQPLPPAFINEVNAKAARRGGNQRLILSVSLLNLDRDDLIKDIDGSRPVYQQLDDSVIVEAYFKHLNYLVTQFQPDYLVMAIEVNDLYLKSTTKWNEYKNLAATVKFKLKKNFPALSISESLTLHNWYQPTVNDPAAYLQEMKTYANANDFAAISFYPFFKGLTGEFAYQPAFDFLHGEVNVPIAMVETAHLAEDLVVPGLNLNIESDECDQREYLEALLENAQWQNYELVIWWTHRDYDELWATFPPDIKDIGQVWRDTGILDEDGNDRPARRIWAQAFNR